MFYSPHGAMYSRHDLDYWKIRISVRKSRGETGGEGGGGGHSRSRHETSREFNCACFTTRGLKKKLKIFGKNSAWGIFIDERFTACCSWAEDESKSNSLPIESTTSPVESKWLQLKHYFFLILNLFCSVGQNKLRINVKHYGQLVVMRYRN